MPRRALAERRPWLLASLAFGISYFLVKDSAVPGLYLMAWKGAGVALLAIYAWLRVPGADGRLLAGVMALGALGDMLIEFDTAAGGAAFFAGHVVAIALYARHRRAELTLSQKLAAAALLLLTPIVAFLLPADRAAAPGVAFYALALGGMAGMAWTSAFPRYRVGLGAAMFVASDLLIFARMGPLAASVLPGLLIWPLYYFGQFLICTGAVSRLRRQAPA
ncbi:MAG TPA: lysoplasmalogenase family protein [Novosphingobium sp.]|nr:lysoplasmalogenase family protein [Novosphingobium sp.]